MVRDIIENFTALKEKKPGLEAKNDEKFNTEESGEISQKAK